MARKLGVISALMTGKFNDFSNDILVSYLTLLGCNVEIRVLPQHRMSRSIKTNGSPEDVSPLAGEETANGFSFSRF
ncbi:MAG: hypothetical protein Q8L98_05510 [Chlamydiales bacterium]|nr:hypothetical protein [Chlamydiales bacterium]